nr:hypothetical protein CFP56_53731 [Quercus suber]
MHTARGLVCTDPTRSRSRPSIRGGRENRSCWGSSTWSSLAWDISCEHRVVLNRRPCLLTPAQDDCRDDDERGIFFERVGRRFCWKRLVWTVHCQFPGSLSAFYSLNRSNLDIFRHLKPSSLATTFPRFDRVSEELQAPARRGAGFILQQVVHGNAVRPVLVSSRGRRPENKYLKSHDSDQWA